MRQVTDPKQLAVLNKAGQKLYKFMQKTINKFPREKRVNYAVNLLIHELASMIFHCSEKESREKTFANILQAIEFKLNILDKEEAAENET